MFSVKTTRVESISENVKRDRYLHVVVDTESPENVRIKDKSWKVRPILEILRQGCLKLGRQKLWALTDKRFRLRALVTSNGM